MPNAKIDDLKPHPRMDIVPRMSENEMKALVADIKENGIEDPLLVTKDPPKLIIDGHNRFEAAKRAGLSEVPIQARKMDEEKVIEYMLRSATFRRQLKDDQRIALLVEYLDHVERTRTKDGKYAGGGATKKKIEAEYGFQPHKLNRARALYNKGAKGKSRAKKLFEKIKAGDMSVNKAHNSLNGAAAPKKPMSVNKAHNSPNGAAAPKKPRKSPTWVPDNLVLGFTLETNRDKGYDKISKAPSPTVRHKGIMKLIESLLDEATGTSAKNKDEKVQATREKQRNKFKIMLTLEPILAFDRDKLVEMVQDIDPCLLWMGYDSKDCKLPEPSEKEFRDLHWALAEGGLNIAVKKPYSGKRKPNWKAMYASATQQSAPFVGCEHECEYCKPSFQRQAKRRGKANCADCYDFKPHYQHFEKRLETSFKPTRFGEFIFFCHMGDIAFCDDEHFWKLIDFIRSKPEHTFLIQTKDPAKAFMRKKPKKT